MTLTAIFGSSRSVRASLPAGDIGAAAPQTRAAQPPMPLPGAPPENNGALLLGPQPDSPDPRSARGVRLNEYRAKSKATGCESPAVPCTTPTIGNGDIGPRENAADGAMPRPGCIPAQAPDSISDRELCRDNLRLFERMAARDGAARWQVSIDHWAAAVAGYEWRAVDFSRRDDDLVAWLNRSGGLEFVQWPGDDGGGWLRPEAAAARLGVTAERLQELVWWADSEAAAGV